ncbi:ABC transporter permease [Synechococcus sp. Nb3U1]|uniref:ABC transporter permease n=1 Tax=Synechococcus sp. Nb3U1 TaxID=1914529 RepID=UPI001F2DA5A2|nr:ABC transporter permease [Synechococcus sp. Nb3U1]MCF2970902.1 ABC transporter permease [Synechococcus sp. Nb3U1]
MRRYWRVLWLFWSTSIAAEIEYRANFFFASLSSLAGLAGAWFGLSLFYQQGHQFGGWSWPEALIVLGVFTILQGVAASSFNANLNRIVQQVQEGTLDFVLLKPISSQFWLSARVFSPWGLTDIAFGLLVILYAGMQLGLPAWAYGLGILPLLLGLVILYSLWFMLGATSIWFVKIYNVTEVLRGLVEAGRFPIVAYPAAYRVFFTFIVPVAFLTTIPAETMLGRVQWEWLFGSGLLAVGLLAGSHAFWRFALRFYTSASS